MMTTARRGFSLLELVFAVAIFTIVMGVAFEAVATGQRSLSQGSARATVDDTAARLIERIVADLRLSGPADPALDLEPGESADDVTFGRAERFDAAAKATVWSASTVRWRFRPVATTATRTESSDGREVAVASGVLPSFRFERGSGPRDDEVEVTVAVAVRLEDGSTYARTLVETVLLRN